MQEMHTQRRLVNSKAPNPFYKDLIFGLVIGLSILFVGLSAPRAQDKVAQFLPFAHLVSSPEWVLNRAQIATPDIASPTDFGVALSGPLMTKKIHQLYRSSPNATALANIPPTQHPTHKGLLFIACLIFSASYTGIAAIWRNVKKNYLAYHR